jgi:flagellar basal-body rod modification protein FlgD
MVIHPTHAATNTTGNNGTNGTGSTGTTGSTTSSSSSSAGVGTLQGTDFLTLMLAQLQNQDPTNPVDSNTFLSQLAELSEVEGITKLNTSFSTLASSLTTNAAMQASSLLGHTALVASSTTTAGATVSGAVSVPQTTSGVVLNITNSAGVLVSQINLGAQSAGLADFTWNGTTSSGGQAPAGTYTLSATYAGATSGSTAATTYVNGTVESVSMGGSGSTGSSTSTSSSSSSNSSTGSNSSSTTGLTLNISGVGSVPFSSVQTISN